jgi:pimeloyl-ACP methyl ester carboxylesterase
MRGMINWYRASPLRVAQPGVPITDLPELPIERLQVRCPHLLIWGANDTALLPKATEGLEDFAPDLTRVTIKGADHWLHHQKPAEVAEAILNWT